MRAGHPLRPLTTAARIRWPPLPPHGTARDCLTSSPPRVPPRVAEFETFILMCILVNCVFMALNPPFAQLEQQTDFVFVVIFTVELLLKVVANGFLCHNGAYLRSLWNWLDFTVVLTAWLSIGFTIAAEGAADGSSNLDSIKAIRAVRVLRPLRTISRVPGMRVLVRALLGAIPPLGGVLLLFVFVLLIFGIVGVSAAAAPRALSAPSPRVSPLCPPIATHARLACTPAGPALPRHPPRAMLPRGLLQQAARRAALRHRRLGGRLRQRAIGAPPRRLE